MYGAWQLMAREPAAQPWVRHLITPAAQPDAITFPLCLRAETLARYIRRSDSNRVSFNDRPSSFGRIIRSEKSCGAIVQRNSAPM
jgi:hypothetical protein